MDKYILPEGEACLLVAVFEHLGEYSERAKENDTSVSDELSERLEEISVYTDVLTHAMEICLNDREYDVIAQRYELSPYAECSTLEEIARNFNVTRERIRQVESKTLRKIKRYMTELNDGETHNATFGLLRKEIESKKNMIDAYKACDFVLSEVYMRDSINCYNAYSKLKIQQAIRKYRDGKE